MRSAAKDWIFPRRELALVPAPVVHLEKDSGRLSNQRQHTLRMVSHRRLTDRRMTFYEIKHVYSLKANDSFFCISV